MALEKWMINLSFIGDNLEVNQTSCLGMSCHIGMDVGNLDLLYYIEINIVYMHFFSYYNVNISHAPFNVVDATLQQHDYKLDNCTNSILEFMFIMILHLYWCFFIGVVSMFWSIVIF